MEFDSVLILTVVLAVGIVILLLLDVDIILKFPITNDLYSITLEGNNFTSLKGMIRYHTDNRE